MSEDKINQGVAKVIELLFAQSYINNKEEAREVLLGALEFVKE